MGTILELKLISQDHHQAQMPRDFVTGLLHVPQHEWVIKTKLSTLNDRLTRAQRTFPITRATTSIKSYISILNNNFGKSEPLRFASSRDDRSIITP